MIAFYLAKCNELFCTRSSFVDRREKRRENSLFGMSGGENYAIWEETNYF